MSRAHESFGRGATVVYEQDSRRGWYWTLHGTKRSISTGDYHPKLQGAREEALKMFMKLEWDLHNG